MRITLDKIPKKDVRIIQGDWNAKIGCDVYQNWKGTIGKFGVGEVNERGARLLEFCKLNNLVVANTFSKHKTSRRITWIAPDGTTRNQIDFILLDRRCKSCIKVNKTRFSRCRHWQRPQLADDDHEVENKESTKTTKLQN